MFPKLQLGEGARLARPHWQASNSRLRKKASRQEKPFSLHFSAIPWQPSSYALVKFRSEKSLSTLSEPARRHFATLLGGRPQLGFGFAVVDVVQQSCLYMMCLNTTLLFGG